MIGRPDRSFHCERRMFRRSRTAETKTRYFSRDYWPGIRKGIGRCRWNDQCQDGDAEQDLTITGQINSSGAVLYRRKAADERKKFRIFWWIVLSSRRWQRNGRRRKYQAASRIFDVLSRLRIATACHGTTRSTHVKRTFKNIALILSSDPRTFVVNSRHDPRSRVAGHASGYSDGNSRRRSIGEDQIRRTRSVRYRAADLKAKSLG